MKTVLIFKTSVKKKKQIRKLKKMLNKLISHNGHWNFDLEDCDNILRVETQKLQAVTISSALRIHGFDCEEL